MNSTENLQARRERIVLDHFADETKQNFDAVLAGDMSNLCMETNGYLYYN